jgi:hypothetical protein
MDDDFLKQVMEAVDGQQIIAQAVNELPRIRAEVDRGEYTFTEVPSPAGSRSFQSSNKKGSSILVCQFNDAEDGIRHAGTAVRMAAFGRAVVTLPEELADYIYHKAAAVRN